MSNFKLYEPCYELGSVFNCCHEKWIIRKIKGVLRDHTCDVEVVVGDLVDVDDSGIASGLSERLFGTQLEIGLGGPFVSKYRNPKVVNCASYQERAQLYDFWLEQYKTLDKVS